MGEKLGRSRVKLFWREDNSIRKFKEEMCHFIKNRNRVLIMDKDEMGSNWRDDRKADLNI